MEGVTCSTLPVNRPLLLAVLAEIKLLFENFAAANGTYENEVAYSLVNWANHSNSDLDLMSYLCIATSDHMLYNLRGKIWPAREQRLRSVFADWVRASADSQEFADYLWWSQNVSFEWLWTKML